MVLLASESNESRAISLLWVAEGKDLLPFGLAVLTWFVIAWLALTPRGQTLSPNVWIQSHCTNQRHPVGTKPLGPGPRFAVRAGLPPTPPVFRNIHMWLCCCLGKRTTTERRPRSWAQEWILIICTAGASTLITLLATSAGGAVWLPSHHLAFDHGFIRNLLLGNTAQKLGQQRERD